jgi:NTE family protein
MGEIALRVLRERYGGLGALRDLDYGMLASLPGAAGPRRGELLSFLLFDERFVEALVEAGRRDAQRWLDRHPKLWCSDATHDLGTIDPGQLEAVREETALSEWRELRAPRARRGPGPS